MNGCFIKTKDDQFIDIEYDNLYVFDSEQFKSLFEIV